jgi:two-component system CheB/CheR fusion protein
MSAKKKPKLSPSNKPAQSPPPVTEFPVVGIGASAGGLAAFEAFFSAMPADTDPGMAFVLVQHLAPDHKSILSELVRRYTRMQVFEVEDGMSVQPNCAYIIPPNCDMAFLNGTLQLLEPSAPRGLRLPIDFFFRSLAQDQRERAICIVLSGTGSDGKLGVRAVKGEGGMVMVQDPTTTEHDGMPRSAIATGLVDYVLPPAEMPAQLIDYATRAFGRIPRPLTSETPKNGDVLKKIFVLLRAQVGHDFSQYKPSTIARRVEHRMAIRQIDRMALYLRYLQQDPLEVEALFRDLLIGVTHFFRDPEVFTALKDQVVPLLFAGKSANDAIRVWVPGCSTGEEAYSIAILLQEQMEALRKSFQVKVFATDIDSQAIEQARSGVYPASIAADITPERLMRYFIPEPAGGDGHEIQTFRVQKVLREMLIFSEQDVIKDPPFSKLDLISCRNLMIYMSGDLQKKLIPLFHYALNPEGFLFLGTSETIGEHTDLFKTLDRKGKLYQCKRDTRPAQRLAFGMTLPLTPADTRDPQPAVATVGEGKQQLRKLTEVSLLDQYGVVAALVNERGEILYLHGRTGRYLEPAPGEADLNILKMARAGLQRNLTSALRKVVALKEPVQHLGLRVKTNGDFVRVNLTVRPVVAGTSQDERAPTHKPGSAPLPEKNLYLVILEEGTEKEHLPPHSAAEGSEADDPDAQILALKEELSIKEEYLQTTSEELETSNEELRSANEEMQSINEELQSTIEELETSKEELQSVNEELSTVNAELQLKVADLSQVNNDMNNLLAGTGIGTIFVDQQLCIQRFTPAVTQVINLIPGDVGRPVGQIVSNLKDYDQLVADVRAVLEDLNPKEIEAETQAGEWFLLRIRPYRTLENVIEGAVITLTNITELKRAQALLRESEAQRRLAVVVSDNYDAITVQDLKGRILAWNPAAERMFGWNEAEALAMNTLECIPENKRKLELTQLQQLCRSEVLEAYRTQRLTKNGQVVDVWLTATALVDEAGEVYAIATTERLIQLEERGKGDDEKENSA